MEAEILTSTVGTKDEAKGRLVRKAKVTCCTCSFSFRFKRNPLLSLNADWDTDGEEELRWPWLCRQRSGSWGNRSGCEEVMREGFDSSLGSSSCYVNSMSQWFSVFLRPVVCLGWVLQIPSEIASVTAVSYLLRMGNDWFSLNKRRNRRAFPQLCVQTDFSFTWATKSQARLHSVWDLSCSPNHQPSRRPLPVNWSNLLGQSNPLTEEEKSLTFSRWSKSRLSILCFILSQNCTSKIAAAHVDLIKPTSLLWMLSYFDGNTEPLCKTTAFGMSLQTWSALNTWRW